MDNETTMNSTPATEPVAPELTDEEIAAQEAAREAELEAKLAPCKEAAKQRRESADVVAEHDAILADVLYELTMTQFGEVL